VKKAAAAVIKGVKFGYEPSAATRELLSLFRAMVNDAIRICLSEKVRGRLNLRDRIYKEFKERYGVVSCYPYAVAEVAWSIDKKHRRWHRRPCARRLMLKMDAASFSLNYSIPSLPFRKGERVLIPLRYGEYQRSFLMDTTLRRGSVTVTQSSIVIAFSKEAPRVMPSRKVGYDLNEKSIVGSDGTIHDLSEVSRLHTLWDSPLQVLRETSPRRSSQEEVRIIKKRERTREPGPAQGLDPHRGEGEGEQRGDRAREAQRDKVRSPEGIRGRDGEATKDRPMALPPAAILHRLQGEVGRSPCGVRLSFIHLEDVQRLRVHQSQAEGHR